MKIQPIFNNKILKQSPKNNQNQTNPLYQFRTNQADVFQKGSSLNFNGKNIFPIHRIEGIHCPYCAQLMLSSNQINDFVDEISNKKGEDLKKALEKYDKESNFVHYTITDDKGILRQKQQIVSDILKKYAVEYPTKNVAELVKLASQDYIPDLINKQMAVVSGLVEYAAGNIKNEDELKQFNEIINKETAKILGRSEYRFKRKNLISQLSEVSSNPKTTQNLVKIAQELPTSEDDVSSFFVKYSHDKTSREIALALVQGTRITKEHMKTKSTGGKNNISNYLYDCYSCNNTRGNKDFRLWIKENPDFESNFITYLNEINENVRLGKIPHNAFETYTDKIINQTYNLTQGDVDVRHYDFENKSMQEKKAKILQTKKGIKKDEQTLATMKDEIKKIEENPDFNIVMRLIHLEQINNESNLNSPILKEEIEKIKLDLWGVVDIDGAIDDANGYISQKETYLEQKELLKKIRSQKQEVKKIYEGKKTKSDNYEARCEKTKGVFEQLKPNDKALAEYFKFQMYYQNNLETLKRKQKGTPEYDRIEFKIKSHKSKMDSIYSSNQKVRAYVDNLNKEKYKKEAQIYSDQLERLNKAIDDLTSEIRDFENGGNLKSIKEFEKRRKDLMNKKAYYIQTCNYHHLNEVAIELEEKINWNSAIVKKLESIYLSSTDKNFSKALSLLIE